MGTAQQGLESVGWLAVWARNWQGGGEGEAGGQWAVEWKLPAPDTAEMRRGWVQMTRQPLPRYQASSRMNCGTCER